MNEDVGGEKGDALDLGGDEGGISGGAEIDFLDFREDTGFRPALVRTGDGRTGEEDSAPDWKILLSSQPLSSA